MDDKGRWAANALLGTLVHLGLVERGTSGTKAKQRWSFRLSPTGKAVFAAPRPIEPGPARDPRFLTVQPNHEVLAYLADADASAIWPLAQMARRVSEGADLVPTFALTRESVYQGLESGLSIEAAREFLSEHSRTGLPANVAQSLMEWGRKRESLVLRTAASLGVYPPGEEYPFGDPSGARQVGEGCVLLGGKAGRQQEGLTNYHHRAFSYPGWLVDESLRVTVPDENDVVLLARLGQFADREGKDWRITADSIRRARQRGISAEQVLAWIDDHQNGDVPPAVETAIRNWNNSTQVFLGEMLVLQVQKPQACAMILSSERFGPLLLGHLPPDTFLVRAEKRGEIERLLSELGFSMGGSYRLTGSSAEEEAEKPRQRRRRQRD